MLITSFILCVDPFVHALTTGLVVMSYCCVCVFLQHWPNI